jgi:putative FmdB family regulatory protein
MPIYEYRCSDCSEKFDLLVRSSAADAAHECPKCKGSKVSRLLSTFAVGGSNGSSSWSDASCQQVCAPAGT